jgi:hypothetical protein
MAFTMADNTYTIDSKEDYFSEGKRDFVMPAELFMEFSELRHTRFPAGGLAFLVARGRQRGFQMRKSLPVARTTLVPCRSSHSPWKEFPTVGHVREASVYSIT